MTKRSLTVLLAAIVTASAAFAGCSGSITTSKVTDDMSAAGLRYFLPRRVEISVYSVAALNPQPTGPNLLKHRIQRIGDLITDTINDPDALWQVTYKGALFANQSVTLSVNDKGAVKSIGLTSAQGNTPVAVGALQAIQKGLETQRDFDKTRQQAKIDELNRQTNLIKAKRDLETALAGAH